MWPHIILGWSGHFLEYSLREMKGRNMVFAFDMLVYFWMKNAKTPLDARSLL